MIFIIKVINMEWDIYPQVQFGNLLRIYIYKDKIVIVGLTTHFQYQERAQSKTYANWIGRKLQNKWTETERQML